MTTANGVEITKGVNPEPIRYGTSSRKTKNTDTNTNTTSNVASDTP